ncbi:azurin [Flavobacteriaceae bacterium XHP0103]|uniref:azurin n=1 Tax=Marixanthotalea marina TaxID=2844359 RepID=UPI002989F7AC|nr:azurin [Marixanthotalea marina]MBU3820959.1 azurin [Marixanthotalea marina]
MNKRNINYVLVTIFSLALLTSCGGEKKKEEEKETIKIGAQKEEEPVVEEADSNVAEVVIVGDDTMRFDLSEIKVKAGQKVKLTLRHKGKMAVNVMGHNFVLLASGVDMVDFATKAASSQATNYIPAGSENDIIAHTNLIGGGQTATIEFDAPAVGTYDFLCSFPGHYAIMKGKFIVE